MDAFRASKIKGKLKAHFEIEDQRIEERFSRAAALRELVSRCRRCTRCLLPDQSWHLMAPGTWHRGRGSTSSSCCRDECSQCVASESQQTRDASRRETSMQEKPRNCKGLALANRRQPRTCTRYLRCTLLSSVAQQRRRQRRLQRRRRQRKRRRERQRRVQLRAVMCLTVTTAGDDGNFEIPSKYRNSVQRRYFATQKTETRTTSAGLEPRRMS